MNAWGLRAGLRHRARPLPTVARVFPCRRDCGRTILLRGPGRPTGTVRDVLVAGATAEEALAKTRAIARRAMGEGAEILALREADPHDVPSDPPETSPGPPRHFGFLTRHCYPTSHL